MVACPILAIWRFSAIANGNFPKVDLEKECKETIEESQVVLLELAMISQENNELLT